MSEKTKVGGAVWLKFNTSSVLLYSFRSSDFTVHNFYHWALFQTESETSDSHEPFPVLLCCGVHRCHVVLSCLVYAQSEETECFPLINSNKITQVNTFMTSSWSTFCICSRTMIQVRLWVALEKQNEDFRVAFRSLPVCLLSGVSDCVDAF